ncbi:hypothetical protein Ac2012v2_001117 [Leucoagaricus gongylophorus]
MIRALFFGVLALLFAAASAVPTVEQGQDIIGDIINALGIGFVSGINITITLESLETNLISVDVAIKNPLPLELTIKEISSSAGFNNTPLANFDHTFPSPGLVVGPLATKNSGSISNVLVIPGVQDALGIVPFGVLDLSNTNAKIQAATIGGFLGFPLELDGLNQDNVPTNYNLELTSS